MANWESTGGQANTTGDAVKQYPDGTTYDFSAPVLYGDPESSPDKNAQTEYYFNKFMEALFWRTLCPRPDGPLNLKLRGWPYNITGKIAGHFHRKTCTLCKGR